MRELKFRVWNKLYEQMEIVTLLSEDTIITEEGFRYNRNEIEVMQYTGLKDKNGVEMYEGDIIRYKYIGEDGESKDYKEKRGVMNFNENQWRINAKHLDGYTMKFYEFEIVGNKYEEEME